MNEKEKRKQAQIFALTGLTVGFFGVCAIGASIALLIKGAADLDDILEKQEIKEQTKDKLNKE